VSTSSAADSSDRTRGAGAAGDSEAWAALVEAARVMGELGGAGVYIVHLDEMPPRLEVVEAPALTSRAATGDTAEHARDGGTLSSPPAAAAILRAAVASSEADGFSAIRWSASRALVVATGPAVSPSAADAGRPAVSPSAADAGRPAVSPSAADAGRPAVPAGARIFAWVQREISRYRDFARSEAVLDVMGEGVVVVDGDHQIVHATRRAAELLGVADPSAAEQRPLRELMPYVVDRLEPNEVARGANGPDNKVTWVAHHPAPAVGATTPRPGLVLRLRSEARFLETRRGQLQLLSALRHDVRSPLTALRGLVSVLQEEPDMPREERQQLLELLRQEAERTVIWVEDYLILLRLRFEPRPLNLVSLTPDAPLRALEAQLAPHAKERGVNFAAEFLNMPPPLGEAKSYIACDPSLLDAFLKNLVGHFLRLADTGATVGVRIEPSGTLVVEGFGPGLFAQHPPNPFTTLARSTASGKRTPGVGLGLFLAKKVADVHGWPISVTSHEGRVRAIVRWTGAPEGA